ncbi:hypothetical protein [Microbacterium sp. P05]|uniref:hypothetical protein n=1 Tax=Microbacterium sp. P05 TaxID=3366948 RepID=UPI0037467A59
MTANLSGSTLEVTGMVPGVSESNGTCTLELLESGASTTVSGTEGNGVTYCGVMSLSVPSESLTSGSFQISYQSASTQAQSAVTALGSAE